MAESIPISTFNGLTARQVLLHPVNIIGDATTKWLAECPSLLTTVVLRYGHTQQEAIERIKEAMRIYIQDLQAKGQVIPPYRSAEETLALWKESWSYEGIPVLEDQVEIVLVEL